MATEMDIITSIMGVLSVILLATITFLLSLLLPPAKSRTYPILDVDENVKYKGTHISTKDLAKKYQPIIKQATDLRGPSPTQMLYEAFPVTDKHMELVYRVVWPDEIHPNPIIHYSYRIFRQFYYGSKADIEYIYLRINLGSGDIEEVVYETDSSGDPDVYYSDHALVSFKKKPNKEFQYHCSVNRNPYPDKTLHFTDKKVQIPVLTWNHVFAIQENNNVDYESFNLPLTPLDNDYFKKMRFDRRSWIAQGEHVNKKLPLLLGIIDAVCAACLLSILFFIG